MSRRAWVIGLVAGVVVLGAAAVAVPRVWPECGAAVVEVAADESSSPFLDAGQRTEQPDADRDTLVTALEAAPAPFGEVLGAVGYHYEQWAQVSAYAQGIGVRTKDNPDFTMLDDQTLKPRWSVEVNTKRSAYDASEDRYLVATLPAKKAPTLVSLDADSGERRWCSELSGGPVGGDDPFATQVLTEGGDVTVLTPGTGSKGKVERLARLNQVDGSTVWQRDLDVDAGDFLGELGDGTLLAGGLAQYELADRESLDRRPAGTALAMVSSDDGKTIWKREAGEGSGLHVVGADPESGTAVVQEWNAQTKTARLIALDREGSQIWYAVPARGALFDATLRGGRILVRVGSTWSAYGIESGSLLWTRTLPAKPQFLPYGFELDSIPLLDDEHALVAGTTALHTLDLRTGAMTSAALPTDGINTTYWPYQVAVSPGLVAVATNTGAVVVRRE